MGNMATADHLTTHAPLNPSLDPIPALVIISHTFFRGTVFLNEFLGLFREGTVQIGNGDNPGILLQDIRPTSKGK
jgi:hypothetical protein